MLCNVTSVDLTLTSPGGLFFWYQNCFHCDQVRSFIHLVCFIQSSDWLSNYVPATIRSHKRSITLMQVKIQKEYFTEANNCLDCRLCIIVVPKQLKCILKHFCWNWNLIGSSTKFYLPVKRDALSVITTHQHSCGKVMFSVVSVCYSFHGVRGFPMWPLPMMLLVSHRSCGDPLQPPVLSVSPSPYKGPQALAMAPTQWTCSSLFNLDHHHTCRDPPLPQHVQICSMNVARTVGKWAVGIQLKCLLVSSYEWNS